MCTDESNCIDLVVYMLIYFSTNLLKVFKVCLYTNLICGVNKNGGSTLTQCLKIKRTSRSRKCQPAFHFVSALQLITNCIQFDRDGNIRPKQ